MWHAMRQGHIQNTGKLMWSADINMYTIINAKIGIEFGRTHIRHMYVYCF